VAEALLYHSTPTQHQEAILANGLLTSKDKTGMGAVFLADLPIACRNFDLWAVDTKGLVLEDDNTLPEEGNWFMCFEDILPHRLTLMR
jgi:hypothetical protein